MKNYKLKLTRSDLVSFFHYLAALYSVGFRSQLTYAQIYNLAALIRKCEKHKYSFLDKLFYNVTVTPNEYETLKHCALNFKVENAIYIERLFFEQLDRQESKYQTIYRYIQ